MGAALGPQSELRLLLRDSPASPVAYRFFSTDSRRIGDWLSTTTATPGGDVGPDFLTNR